MTILTLQKAVREGSYEEYKEYFYSKHYLRYDKIVEKWFSECKKKVTD